MSNTAVVESAVAADVSNDAHGMILDLSDVTYLDSAGIRLLYHLESRLAIHQQRLVIVVPTRSVIVRTLQAAGVIGSLVLASSLDEAVIAVRGEDQHETGSNGETG
jgi:anti-anti-sigma factor